MSIKLGRKQETKIVEKEVIKEVVKEIHVTKILPLIRNNANGAYSINQPFSVGGGNFSFSLMQSPTGCGLCLFSNFTGTRYANLSKENINEIKSFIFQI